MIATISSPLLESFYPLSMLFFSGFESLLSFATVITILESNSHLPKASFRTQVLNHWWWSLHTLSFKNVMPCWSHCASLSRSISSSVLAIGIGYGVKSWFGKPAVAQVDVYRPVESRVHWSKTVIRGYSMGHACPVMTDDSTVTGICIILWTRVS